MSKLLIQESPLTFQPSLASAIGLNEAIILQQIHYWVSNPKNKGYDQGGHKWVYNTYAEWKENNFPFWSEHTIQRIFLSLEEKGLIVSIQPMAGKYDRTKYYRIEYAKLDIFDDAKSASIDSANLACSLDDTENTSENTTYSALPRKLDLVDLELTKLPSLSLRNAISEHFRLNVNWDTKTSRQWLEWAHNEGVTAEQIASAADTWRMDKQFNWQQPSLKGIFEKWQMLMSVNKPQNGQRMKAL